MSVRTSGFGSVSLIHAAPVNPEMTPKTALVLPDSYRVRESANGLPPRIAEMSDG